MFNIIRDFPTNNPIFATVASKEEAYKVLRDCCGKLVAIPGGWHPVNRSTERFLLVPV